MPSGPSADGFTLAPTEHFTKRPGKPYVWATWLCRYLSGSDQCLWKLWFKAHHKYAKLSDPTFDSAQYTRDHDACVLQRKKRLEEDGYTVTLERENEFKWEGRSAVLAGRIDLVAERQREAPLLPLILIDDVKTGNQHGRDFWQVLTYVFAWMNKRDDEAFEAKKPFADPVELRGEVVYRDRVVPVDADEHATTSNWKKINALLKVAGGNEPPLHTPTAGECGFCDIPKTCCPKRIEEKPKARRMSDDF